eukprot:jgi/Chlat1/2819/Chrsp187S02965
MAGEGQAEAAEKIVAAEEEKAQQPTLEKEDGEVLDEEAQQQQPGGEDEEGAAQPGDSQEAPAKHPLECRWTLWVNMPAGRKDKATYGGNLKAVYTFGTVEDFWCMYNNVVPPSRLPTGAGFSLFKEGIQPKWEDKKCEQGGTWTAQMGRDKGALDASWLNFVLAMVGEQFADGEEVCGGVVSVRARQDRIEFWTKTASNEAMQLKLGSQLKEFMGLDHSSRMGYTVHQDAMHDSRAKDRYML